MIETIAYMGIANAKNLDADVFSSTCGDALYLKAYASVDLGQLDEAKKLLEQAIAFSPLNARYISELGNLYQTQKDWNKALALFTEAEGYAESFSPDKVKNNEWTRAKRGVGYNLIELGKLDEAEKKYNECLAINKDDKTAATELKYIQQLRNKH